MKCPFRIRVDISYYPRSNNMSETERLEKSRAEEFQDCYEGECPYYNYTGSCNRIGDE